MLVCVLQGVCVSECISAQGYCTLRYSNSPVVKVSMLTVNIPYDHTDVVYICLFRKEILN